MLPPILNLHAKTPHYFLSKNILNTFSQAGEYGIFYRTFPGMNRLLTLLGCFLVTLISAVNAQTSGVLREVWSNLEGSSIPDLTLSDNYPSAPLLRTIDSSFASPVNWAERYGMRMRAFLTPTTSGSYTFYISGDDDCELWLSTNDSAASKVKIASLPSYSNPQQWTKFASQKSVPISLVAGQRYYIEALMKEGYGGDHVEVGWADSPTATPVIIPGSHLTPFEVPSSTPTGLIVEAGKAVTQHAPNFLVELQAQALNQADANVTPSILWTQVSGKTAALSTATLASTKVTLPSAGTYVFRATATVGSTKASDDVTVTISAPLAPDAGKALAEYWFGVSGSTVAALSGSVHFPKFPQAHRMVTSLTSTSSLADQYGERMRGFLLVPKTGSYRFFLAANETAEFRLSTDDTAAKLALQASVTKSVTVGDFANQSTQASGLITLTAGQKYAFEILHKEEWGSDHVSLMWQQPGQEFMTEITSEYLAPPADAATVVASAQEFKLTQDYNLFAGRDATLYWPRNSLPLSAFESRRIWANDTPSRLWSMVSGPGAALFSAADKAQTLVTFPKVGTYVLRYAVTTTSNTSTDDITVNIVNPLNASVGSLMRQVWWNRSFSTLAQFRADAAFPLYPDFSDNIPDLRQTQSWADNYGTRVTGILNVPAGGKADVNYTFYVSGDDEAEFSISTDATPANLRKVCFTTNETNPEQWNRDASQTSAPIPLKPGGRYFIELVHRAVWGSDHFAVAWSPEGDKLPQVITGSLVEPVQKLDAFDKDQAFYASAGRDRTYWWPHDRLQLAGKIIRALSSSATATALWKQTSGPKATILAPTSVSSDVVLSAIGTYSFELAVTEGSRTSRDSLTITVNKAFTTGTGALTRSVWLDVEGGTLANLTTYDPQLAYPHFEDLIPGAEPPRNWADYYGQRLKGTLTVPVAGRYTFWIASDHASDFQIDLKDSLGMRRVAFLDHDGHQPRMWDDHAEQKSAEMDLLANTPYPIQILHKEREGSDHLSLAMSGPATNGREVVSRAFLTPDHAAPAFNPEITVAVGSNRTLLWPQNQVAIAALVYDLNQGPQPLSYQWSSASTKVTFDQPKSPVAMLTFTSPGIYEIKMTATDGTNTASDSLIITVQNPLTPKSGGLLREVFTGIGGSSITDLTNAKTYKEGKPNSTDILPNFETPTNWADNYGQRLSGYLQVPVDGDYVFLIASDDQSELWLNATGEGSAGLAKVCSAPWATGRYNWTSNAAQKSASIRLTTGKRYSIMALQKEGGGDDYLAVAYRLASQTDAQAQVIPGVLLSPPDGVNAQLFDAEMTVKVSEPQSGYWPKSRYTVRATALDLVPGPQALAFRWSILSGPAGANFDTPTAIDTSVEFTKAGTYQLQITATDGKNSRSANTSITVSPALGTGTGSILAEVFKGITGSWVTDLTKNAKYPNSPDERYQLKSAEIPSNAGDNYGTLIRGYVYPPVSGVYRFNLASDEWSEVYLSTDRTPEKKDLLCFVPAATDYYEWRKFPDYQLSRPVSLVKGQSYYLEIRYKESGWRDHLALAWLCPGKTNFEVIDGAFLAPLLLADKAAPSITLTGGNAVTVGVGGTFVDPGFSATDGIDGNLTGSVRVEGTVDTSTPGTYTLRYVVTDQSGNQSVVATRRVTVAVAANTDPVYPADTSGTHSTTAWTAPATISDIDAARFLKQATFGPTEADIAKVKQLGFSKWIDEQLSLPVTSHLEHLDRMALFKGAQQKLLELSRTANTLGLPGAVMPMASTQMNTDDRLYSWWTLAMTSPDQLRQRVALALSEILVISDRSGSALRNYPRGCTNYYDMLVKSVVPGKPYRQLLEDVTLNPIMGTWLTMVRSNKTKPDENYAREIMQLFSIGLEHLNKDGTFKRNSAGNAIPTYTQDEIRELARAFTGWTYANSRSFTYTSSTDVMNAMMAFEDQHDRGQKVIVGGATVPAGQTALQDIRRCVDILAAHPNVGPFMAERLIQRLVTSNPSPAYIFRVSKVWDDNGKGVRGDLCAVVKAILLDHEARTLSSTPESGKLSEPMIRLSRLMRAFGRAPSSNPPLLGRYLMWNAISELGQWPMQAPTVFNFFKPNYSPPGPVLAAGIVSPEFEITTELTATDTANYLFEGVTNGFYTNNSSRITLDLSPFTNLWSTPDTLMTKIEVLLLGRPMSASLRSSLMSLHTLHAANASTGIRVMLQLLTASPEFAMEK
jgi:uncharacterized protein (DUF1800 family)